MCRVSHSQGSESASEAPFEGLKHQSRIGFSVRVQGNRSLLQKGFIVNPIKLETGKRTNSAGIPYTLLLRIEAIGFPTFGLLL